jgi:hypothetical protein
VLEAIHREDDLREREMCAISLHLGDGGDGEADAADDEVRWRLMWPEGEQLHRVIELGRPQDEAIVLEFRDPKVQRVPDTHSEDRGLRRLVGDRRVVVAIDDRDGLRWQKWLHTSNLLPRKTNGNEAGPPAARGGAARAHLFENAERQLHEVKRRRAWGNGVVDGCGWCHNGNSSVGDAARCFTWSSGYVFEREQIPDGEHLRGEQTIESAEAEGASAAKKIGDMRGLES